MTSALNRLVPPDHPAGDGPHVAVIEPRRGWRSVDWTELWHYRDLLRFMVLRNVKILYKQTILGLAWAIVRPAASMLVFTVIFGSIAQVGSDGVPYAVFSYAALVPWTYFASALTDSTTSLVDNHDMLTKIYFPRLVFPFAPVIAKLLDFVIALGFGFLLLLSYGIVPNANLLALPILVLIMVITALGTGTWLCALAVQYRDVRHAMQFVVQLLMYAAPVVWPVSALTERFGETARLLYGIYPMVGVIEGFRSALLNTHPMPWDLIGIGAASASLILFAGTLFFKRTEGIFADVA